MSAPHHHSTATGSEHKDQHNSSRIQISHLLCSIEATESTKSAPWDSPRTETLQFEDPSQQRNQPRTLQQSADINPTTEQQQQQQQQQQDSDSDSDIEEQYDRHPFASPQSTFNKNTIDSSPVNHLTKHFSYSSSLTSPLGRTGYSYSHSTSPRQPIDIDRRDSGLGRRDNDARESAYPSYSHSYKTMGREPLSRNSYSERTTPTTSPTSTEPNYFSSQPASSRQRSFSQNTDYHQDQLHPYEAEDQLQQRRKEHSKSDYALHQQNYGPYLNASPTIPSATLFSSNRLLAHSQQHSHDLSTPPPSLPRSSYFREHVASLDDLPRSSYPALHSPYRSTQSDPRRPSQGIILPPPDAMLVSPEPKKTARIYGRDAADGPSLSSFASFTPKPSYDTPEQNRMDYAHKSFSRRTSKDYSHYLDERHSSIATYPHDSRYQNSVMERPSYDYGPYDSRRPSAPGPPAPSSQPRADYNAHSPRIDIQPPSWYQQYAHAVPSKSQPRQSYMHEEASSIYTPREQRESGNNSTNDIQPPSWYQQYAHAVPHKPQSRVSNMQDDSISYSMRDHRESGIGPLAPPQSQHRPTHDSWSTKSTLPLTPPTNENDQRRMSSVIGIGGGEGYSQSSRSTRKSTSHSVHPFDMPIDAPASPPKPSKRDREQEDDCAPEDGVKAKRKRANAEQLSVLNAAFERSYFPSTEERLRLSKQTKMCPRTVQIWFQNKRQSVKARTEAMDVAVASTLTGRRRASQAVDRPSLEERRLDDRRHNRGGLEEMMGGHNRQTSSTLSQSNASTNSTAASAAFQHGEKRRRSGPLTPADQDIVVDSHHIQLDSRSVDYFSRKRRATIAKMELNQSP
ncbi:hypothetical protein FBU30_000723 [Linnemannia zychae]|nr:hypothetical protein FBU30_000723 [Linnemannia zychae]